MITTTSLLHTTTIHKIDAAIRQCVLSVTKYDLPSMVQVVRNSRGEPFIWVYYSFETGLKFRTTDKGFNNITTIVRNALRRQAHVIYK